jgi:hypothetical protein
LFLLKLLLHHHLHLHLELVSLLDVLLYFLLVDLVADLLVVCYQQKQHNNFVCLHLSLQQHLYYQHQLQHLHLLK